MFFIYLHKHFGDGFEGIIGNFSPARPAPPRGPVHVKTDINFSETGIFIFSAFGR